MSSKDLYLRLLRYVFPYWRIFLVGILAMAVTAATEPAFPALLKPMLDGSFVNKDPETMRWMPFLIVAIFVVRGVATYISSYAISWVSNKVVMDLRELMFARIVNLPDVRERIAGEGADPVGNTPAEFQAFIKSEAAKLEKVVKAAKITVN